MNNLRTKLYNNPKHQETIFFFNALIIVVLYIVAVFQLLEVVNSIDEASYIFAGLTEIIKFKNNGLLTVRMIELAIIFGTLFTFIDIKRNKEKRKDLNKLFFGIASIVSIVSYVGLELTVLTHLDESLLAIIVFRTIYFYFAGALIGLILYLISLFYSFKAIYGKQKSTVSIEPTNLFGRTSKNGVRKVTLGAVVVLITSMISLNIYQKSNPRIIDPFDYVKIAYSFQGQGSAVRKSYPYLEYQNLESLSREESNLITMIVLSVNNEQEVKNGDEILVKASLSDELAAFYNIKLASFDKIFIAEGLDSAPNRISLINDYKSILASINQSALSYRDEGAEIKSINKKATLYSYDPSQERFNNTFNSGTIMVVYELNYQRNGVTYTDPIIFFVTGININGDGDRLNADYDIQAESNLNFFETTDALIEQYTNYYAFVIVEGE